MVVKKSFLNILKIISLVEKWISCKEQWTATTMKSLLVSNPTHLADRGFFWPIACLGASQLLAWHVWHISSYKNKTNRTKANNRKNNCQSIHPFKFCGVQDGREGHRKISSSMHKATIVLFLQGLVIFVKNHLGWRLFMTTTHTQYST